MFTLEDKRQKIEERKLSQIKIGEVADYNGRLFMCVRDSTYYDDERCFLNLSTLTLEALEDIDDICNIPLVLVNAHMTITEEEL